MIIALCAALNAAATPLLERPAAVVAAPAQQWLLRAQAELTTCQNDVRFLVNLGLVLQRARQPEAAAEHLERALLLAPNDPQALRAFAGVLRELGDTAAAREILALAPPLPSAPVVDEANANAGGGRAGPHGAPVASATPRGVWGLTAGHERNLLGVSSQTNITLTLPGLDPSQPVIITLPVDEASRPRAGAYTQLSAAAQWGSGAVEPGRSEWSIQLGTRLRHVPSLQQAGFGILEAAADHQRRYALQSTAKRATDGSQWGHYLSGSGAYLDSRTGIRFAQAAWAGGLLWSAGDCQGRVGVDLLDRRYISNQVLDGRQHALTAQWACSRLLTVSARQGREFPHNPDRPGGGQELSELRLRGSWGLWLWEADWGRVLDDRGYSPLIESGATRSQTRRSLRVERVLMESARGGGATRCPTCNQHQWMLGMEAQKRESNLNLFKSNNLGIYAALRITK